MGVPEDYRGVGARTAPQDRPVNGSLTFSLHVPALLWTCSATGPRAAFGPASTGAHRQREELELIKVVKTALLAAVAGVGLAIAALPAAAAVVCNREGECWHVRGHYAYRPEYGVVVHRNEWRWRRGDHYVWREHEGRGYWRHGVWIQF